MAKGGKKNQPKGKKSPNRMKKTVPAKRPSKTKELKTAVRAEEKQQQRQTVLMAQAVMIFALLTVGVALLSYVQTWTSKPKDETTKSSVLDKLPDLEVRPAVDDQPKPLDNYKVQGSPSQEQKAGGSLQQTQNQLQPNAKLSDFPTGLEEGVQ